MLNESSPPERMAGRSVIVLAILLSLSVHFAVLTAWYRFSISQEAEDDGDSAQSVSLHVSFTAPASEGKPEPPGTTGSVSTPPTEPSPAASAPEPESILFTEPAPAPVIAADPPPAPVPAAEPGLPAQETFLQHEHTTEPAAIIVSSLAASTESTAATPPAGPAESEHRPASVQTRTMQEDEIEALQTVLAQLQTLSAQQLEEAFNTNSALPIDRHIVEVTDRVPADLTRLASYEVAIRYEENGQQFSTTATLSERAFSHYAKFVHRWDPLVSMSEDRIEGHFHSNSAVNLFADYRSRPEFDGPVTIAATQHISRRTRRSGLFPAGVETGVDAVPLPATAMPAPFLLSPADIQLHTVDRDTRLTFLPDGRYQWQDLDDPDNSGMGSTQEQPLLVAATGNARLEVSGEVHGIVALFSPRRITINDSLVYAENQADHSQLTLISDGNIEIASQSVTGGGDLHIHAAIYARQRFSVRRFRDRHQGELYIFGSLIAGSLSATEPRFTTHIRHDPRFENNRAPAFPGTGQVQLSSWDQQWSVQPLTEQALSGVPDIDPLRAGE
jgi:hypothetical protein